MKSDETARGPEEDLRRGAEPGSSGSSASGPTGPSNWTRFLERIRARGPVFARFRDDGELARGGMGAVHQVRDENLDRTLAMKVILERDDPLGEPADHAATSVGSLGRFLEEARVTGQLDHPGIVPVHDIGLDDRGRVYFTMKLVQGDDLRTIIERVHDPAAESWSMTRALGTLLKVCEAMAYAHEKGVIHRDLKPSNIMVGRHGQTYVMDWGLAKVLGQEDPRDLRLRCADTTRLSGTPSSGAPDEPLHTMDGEVVGTPAYMPPEQAAGRIEEIAPRSDVYAVGALLYHLLSGQMPYVEPGDRPSPHTILAMVLRGPPTPIDQLARSIPPELTAICEKAMARRIEARYATMEELARELRAFLENRVVGAYESGPVAELRKWIARNRAAALTAGLAAVLLAGLTIWFVRNVQARERDVTARKAEFDQLSGVVLLAEAIEREAELHPAWPERVPELKHWLDRDADRLLKLLPTLERTIRDLEDRATPNPGSSTRAEGAPAPLLYAEEAQSFLHATLVDLAEGINRFETEQLARVKQRLDWARKIGGLTDDHPEASVSWQEARVAIARADGLGASERYRDQPIELLPQTGLVPIGMNPVTRLWEFYHLRSACDPGRGAAAGDLQIPAFEEDGTIRVGRDTGIIFVLVPGGRYTIGSQADDPSAPHHDPLADEDEEPVHVVTLAPYFLARHELTMGQWQRLSGGGVPSWHERGRIYEQDPEPIHLAHPVNQVSWVECDALLRRFGLCLPTEVQWEAGARAGTASAWHSGSTPASLDGAANLLDLRAEAAHPGWGRQMGDFEDGFISIAPVGRFRANAFGLQDMHGNVWEWCRDGYGWYGSATGEGDGLREVSDDGKKSRVLRGGCYNNPALNARSSYRFRTAAGFRDRYLGARAARPLLARDHD